MNYGDWARSARKAAGYTTQQSLADDCGLSWSTISALESGARLPRLSNLLKICRTLNLTPAAYLCGSPVICAPWYWSMDPTTAMRRCRQRAGLSLMALSKKSGFTANTIMLQENGVSDPGMFAVIRLAEALGVGLDEYLGFI